MTLVVASIKDSVVWMVADSAITGGPISLRDRVDEIKVISLPGSAAVAFAGDSFHGRRALHEAQSVGNGQQILEHL
ncbi:MAG TPA: hypothetical protein VG742_20585, partial [Dongiaceae bacterium]|nr:hypothetical protein [Dongiaceae bacterium]